MPSTLRRILRIPIIVFCLWHMTGVFVYSLPTSAADPVSVALKATVVPAVTPYMLSSSQWQLWNLFSPDPLRRVVAYRIDAQNSQGNWVPVKQLSAYDIHEWRRADELKILRYLEDNPQAITPLRERYIRQYCEPLGLEPGTNIRFVFRYYVIPYLQSPNDPVIEPSPEQWIEEPGAYTVCPQLSDPIVPITLP